MKRSISAILITLLLNSVFAVGVLAQSNMPDQYAAYPQRTATASSAKQQHGLRITASDRGEAIFDISKADKETMASYQRSKAAGNKFSTQTKILIGVGIAAAIAGVVIYAASRDKIRTF